MKYKTIQLIIKTNHTNEALLEIFDNGTDNLKDMDILLLEIRVVGSANSIIKGINYEQEKNFEAEVYKKFQDVQIRNLQ